MSSVHIVAFGWLTVVTPGCGAWSASPGTVISGADGNLYVSPKPATDSVDALELEWDDTKGPVYAAGAAYLVDDVPTPSSTSPHRHC